MFGFVVTWFILTGCKSKAEYPSNDRNEVLLPDWENADALWSLRHRWPAYAEGWTDWAAETTEIGTVNVTEGFGDGSATPYPCDDENATLAVDVVLSNRNDPEVASTDGPGDSSSPRISSNQTRIVGGNSVQITQYPFMAQLILLKKNGLGIFCGGTLISETHILTAGHCVTEPTGHLAKAKNILVRLGATNLSCGGEIVPVCKVYRHPKYSPLSKKLNGAAIYDIAVLKLKREVTFSEYVSPVTLATQEDTDKLIRMAYANWPCQVLGWGWTKAGVKLDTPGVENTMSKSLMVATVNLVDWTECRTIVPILEMNAELCCSSPYAASGCKGDSGGPLICEQNKEYGLVSRGTGAGCGIPNLPYIYTRIDTLHKYIANIMKLRR